MKITIASVATIEVPAKLWPNLLRSIQDYRRERRKSWVDRYICQSSELPLCMLVDQRWMTKAVRAFVQELRVKLAHFSGDFDFRKSE